MDIIFLSNQLFDYPLKTNKWHVATRITGLGHRVLFIDPPIRFRKFLKQVLQGRWSLRRILTFTYRPQGNLLVYTPIGVLSSGRVRSLTTDFRNTILWVYHVEMDDLEDYVEDIPHKLLVYDCVDNYPAFPRYRKDEKLKEWIGEREEWLTKKANVIFTSAPGLTDKLKQWNDNVRYVGNSGDYERFGVEQAAAKGEPGVLKNVKRPIVGFSGAIDAYKVNLPLLVNAARAYPNYSFVLIGPKGVADKEPALKELDSLPNVYLLGQIEYDDLPPLFWSFDAYFIPYNLNDYTLGGCFPVKFFDALSAGLPTIVTDLPAYREFSDVCYVARNEGDFVGLIKKAIEENSKEKVFARQIKAKDNTWDKKVEKMISIISESL